MSAVRIAARASSSAWGGVSIRTTSCAAASFLASALSDDSPSLLSVSPVESSPKTEPRTRCQIDSDCCGSMSIRLTDFFMSFRATPRCATSVVLPAPTFVLRDCDDRSGHVRPFRCNQCVKVFSLGIVHPLRFPCKCLRSMLQRTASVLTSFGREAQAFRTWPAPAGDEIAAAVPVR